jgi:hypothetical protein
VSHKIGFEMKTLTYSSASVLMDACKVRCSTFNDEYPSGVDDVQCDALYADIDLVKIFALRGIRTAIN